MRSRAGRSNDLQGAWRLMSLRPVAPVAVVLALGMAGEAGAAEGGAGFYMLGTRTIGAGMVPPPGTYAQTGLYAFSGKADAAIPEGGRLEVGLEGDAAIGLFSGIWAPATGPVLGARPYMLVTLPYGWKRSSVSATLTGPDGSEISGARTEDSFLFGDPVVGGGLGWDTGPWFASANLLVNVPAGDYATGRSTNVAFNRWAADLTGAVTYLSATGWQGDLAVGLTINGENPATDYQTGTELHVEGAVARTRGGWTLGLAGYQYAQVTGDSGEGAILGDFKGRVSALGPAVTWVGAWGAQPVSLDARWFHEFDAENRIPGDAIFLNLTFPLAARLSGD